MRYGPVLAIIIGFGALVGWFAPDLSAERAPAGPVHLVDRQATLAMARKDEALDGTEVVLARAGDGHFYAEVIVDATSASMLVDTGASMVALTAEDADALGVAWDPADVEPVARGASGPVYGVHVTIDRMQVGPFEATGVEAVVVPQGLGISLLGQTFLSQIPKVEIDRQKMVLGG